MSSRTPVFDWDDLRVFHAIVSAGSLTAAAERLGVRQPTVSRRLDALETRIGARLLMRGSDGVELTETGERIWGLVQSMQGTAQDIERVAAQADKAEQGRVRLAAPDGLAAFWIARHLPGFVEANPLIRLEITATDAERGASEPDIALQLVETKRMSLIAQPLATLHYLPLASQRYLDAYGAPETLSELMEHRLADFASAAGPAPWPREAAAIREMMRASVTTDSGAMLIHSVLSGATIALCPSYVAALSDELVHLDLDLHAAAPLWMVYHPDQRKIARVRKVLDWLREIFDSARYPFFRRDYVAPADFALGDIATVRDARPRPAAARGGAAG